MTRAQFERRMDQLPIEAVHPSVAAVTTAVLLGAKNFREISDAIGWGSPGDAYSYARMARDAGLITFADRKSNTVRPALQIVAFTPRERT